MTKNLESALTTELIEGQPYFKITDVDEMRPFLMTLVSNSDHWMFISSNGGLTAGRKNAEYALFPYYTDDKLAESTENTGCKTIIRLETEDKSLVIWEPFSIRSQSSFSVQRNLYKSKQGNRIIFEEINQDLQLAFRYRWSTSEEYGFVRKSTLSNIGQADKNIEWIDGLQNVLPYGVESDLQSRASNLVDAYKRTELDADSGLGVFALSAMIIDQAEPGEALRANVIWSTGVAEPTYLLSSLQLDNFRKGYDLRQEEDVKGEKGAYFVNAKTRLEARQSLSWQIIANTNQNHAAIARLKAGILDNTDLLSDIKDDIEDGTERLIQLNASSDGLQRTNDPYRDCRHFSNVMFNIMRGGIFDDNYTIEKTDFSNYLHNANIQVFEKSKETLNTLPGTFSVFDLWDLSNQFPEPDFKRLSYEYLPLKFSRRHGDPSRPWNKFSINTRNELDGSKVLDYEGNWRDIFQNWEALAISFPAFLEGMVYKFLNTSTFEGYNPYRITKGGFDWEIVDPDDPWAYIGYWGDHQIIYLLKLLEMLKAHQPGRILSLFDESIFVYAQVPYIIKPYEDILADAKNTIDFDDEQDENIRDRRDEIGADGALLKDQSGDIYQVNFVEKILATTLAKLSNLIPGIGIWMNTQRPEWNDANNALVGNGVSMVTLYYLYRFLHFWQQIFETASEQKIAISEELLGFYHKMESHIHAFDIENQTPSSQRNFIDQVGRAASEYRHLIYKNAFSGHKEKLSLADISSFTKKALQILSHSIDQNQRPDKLYHAYNLVEFSDDTVQKSHLDEMLEGQVAVLSSGYIDGEKALKVLDGMKESSLFRPDQYSYLLYPNKDIPGFFEKNIIPAHIANSSKLIQKLVADENKQIVTCSIKGQYHFNGDFISARFLEEALEQLDRQKYGELVDEEKDKLLAAYETVFNHKAFTGRSGTFFGYEGLGSIYWHMVSKLLLAVQEACFKAIQDGESTEVIGRLMDHYYEIQAGIGVHKSPKLYGAFPVDAYSHTPAGKGAQQPGMTGQVKEDILSRFGELGVFVRNGCVQFNPHLLRQTELLATPASFSYRDIHGQKYQLSLPAQSLAFTYCQVPVVYHLADKAGITVNYSDGSITRADEPILDSTQSESLFKRHGAIVKISVQLTTDQLR